MRKLLEFVKLIGPYLLFWTWNVIFVAFAAFGLAPFVLVELWREVWVGWVPLSWMVWLLIAIAIPIASSGLALTKWIRREPSKLVGLLFAVEAPVFLLALVRLFLVRVMNAGLLAVALAVLLSAAVYLALLVRPEPASKAGTAGRLAGHGAAATLAAFLACWVLFYAVPLLLLLLRALARESFWAAPWRYVGLWEAVLALLGGALFLFSASLFVALPVAFPVLHVRALIRAFRHGASRLGARAAWAATGAGAVALVAAFALASRQPQRATFELLARTPGDEGERARLLSRSDEIRSGLVNAYLASYRYAGAAGTDDHVVSLFREIGFGDATAREIQSLYGLFGWPIRYDGPSFHEDHDKAAAAYQAFFDARIADAEREAIREAAASAIEGRVREAQLEDVGAERVLLARQELRVHERGDWAELELHETYENQTRTDQEVVYSFSLPETAVVTDLWLGMSDDRTARVPCVVAPRGAAQQVYREQIAKRRDPALLEQVGPRQYRLRVFPVPARPDSGPTPRLHLWMEYQVLVHDRAWPLPRLAERRNVYWSRRTERALAGAPSPEDGWLPESVPAKSATPPARHAVALPGGPVVIAAPVNPDSLRIQPVRLAVLLDTSRSMGAHAKAVASELAWIREALRAQTVHLFVAAAPSSGRGPEKLEDPSTFRPADLVWYGNLEWGDLLAQLEKLRGNAEYDAVAVVTDEGAYESATAKPDTAKPFPVLWMIHADGAFPRAYADPILDLLSRPGSGIAATLADAMRRYSSAAAMPNATTDLADGYQWSLETTQTASAAPEDPFAPFAARQLVLAMGRGLAGRGLSGLDDVHAVAVRHHIATPYSSMLVLVDDEQRKRLEALAAQEDRFEREAPQEVAVAQGSDLLVSGVPEPREWVLIGVAAAMLLATVRKRRTLQS